MIIYDKEKIKLFLKKYKIAIFVLIFVVTIFVLLITNKDKVADISTSPAPVATNKTISNENKIVKSDDFSYYSNKIATNNDIVTGFSWKENQIIYSTKNGIFEGGTNNPIYTGIINKINWSDNFNAMVFKDNSWNVLKYSENNIKEFGSHLNNPVISNNGINILDFTKNNIFIYNTDTETKRELKFNEPVTNIEFSRDGNSIVVATNYAAKSYFYLLDINLNIKKTFESNDNYKLLSVSPDASKLAISVENKLTLVDFDKIISNVLFRDRSVILAGFKTNNELIVIEKYKDNLDRTLDNIYLINNNKTSKISNSNAIINRINFEIPLKFNSSNTIATFAENKGKTWILSLKSNLYPTYSESGELVFSNIKPQSH